RLLADADVRSSPAVLRRAYATLSSAAADRRRHPELRQARLPEELEPGGFDVLGGMPSRHLTLVKPAPARSAPVKSVPMKPPAARSSGRREAAQRREATKQRAAAARRERTIERASRRPTGSASSFVTSRRASIVSAAPGRPE